MLPLLTPQQHDIATRPADQQIYLDGPAGAGKTTTATARLAHLLGSGVPADQIIIFTPQRTLAAPYRALLSDPGLPPAAAVELTTFGGLARRTLELFWPLAFAQAGFGDPYSPPTFLTLETAQVYMAQVVRPLRRQGYFDAISLDPNRLYSQLLDNLNKAALVGFPIGEIGERLTSAWVGDETQRRVYADVQLAVTQFRDYCLAHNLLDFSLQVELFNQVLWPDPTVRAYLHGRYRHLIADNLEEDVPTFHDRLAEWLPDLDSALLLVDSEAGYRLFLGADPVTAEGLRDLCAEQHTFNQTFVAPPAVIALEDHLTRAIDGLPLGDAFAEADPRTAFSVHTARFTPQMINWAADEAARLVKEEGVPPGEIVILAPFLSDALRFSLRMRLEGEHGLPVSSHRPSRALEEEPATGCLLTLARLAHPAWGLLPDAAQVGVALQQAIEGLDPVRAQLLAEMLYRPKDTALPLQAWERLRPDAQQRITYVLGERYQRLHDWLAAYRADDPALPLDHFLQRLFGELLAQPGYRFHRDFDSARVAANLVESVFKFRQVLETTLPDVSELNRAYLQIVDDGLLAALYVENWQATASESILLAPAYTFLLSNRPVMYQFWLNVNSRGWNERLYQPLTQPYILSRRWQPGTVWMDEDEQQATRETLSRLAAGLLRRLKGHLYLGLTEIDEQGYQHQGDLLGAFAAVMRHFAPSDEG